MAVKLGIVALLALVLVGLNAGIGWAGLAVAIGVNIDDLTDTPSVTLQPPFPPALSPTILPDTAGEFLHFTLPASPNQQAITFYSDFFEDVLGGTLSDRLLVSHVAGSAIVDVQFASDPATIMLPAGATNRLNLVENGDFQFAGILPSQAIGSYAFQVRSDRADVPAPATLLLLGFGLVALGGARVRRRRTEAARRVRS